MKILGCFLLLLFTLTAAGHERLIVRNVNVVDVVRGRLLRSVTVEVSGGQFTSIRKGGTKASDSRVIDGTGKYMIPGLWDMHVHIDGEGEWMFPLFLANGVVGVRDMGGELSRVAEWRAMKQHGDLMPELVAAGQIVSGRIGDADPRMILVGDRSEAEAAVDRLAAAKVDLVKVHDWISRDAYTALLARAKRRGLYVAGHQPVSMTAEEISNLGQRSVEHFGNTWGGLLIDCSANESDLRSEAQKLIPLTKNEFNPLKLFAALGPDWHDRLAESFDPAKAERLARVFRRNGTWFDPMIFGSAYAWTFVTPKDISGDPRLKYLPLSAQKAALDAAREPAPARSASVAEAERKFYRRTLEIVRTMHRGGVGILAGTDALPFPPLYPGFSLHDELEKLVEAGLSNADALRAATVNPAKFLERRAGAGTIAVGQPASFVLLDADPLLDIRNTKRIRAVAVGGRFLDRDALDQMLRSVAEKNRYDPEN